MPKNVRLVAFLLDCPFHEHSLPHAHETDGVKSELTDNVFKNMVKDMDAAVAKGESPLVFDMHVYAYGPQVVSQPDWKDFEKACVLPAETDIAGAPAEAIQQTVAERLKALHGHRYVSDSMTPWRSWAAQILTLERHEQESAITAGAPPENVIHLFRSPDLAQNLRFHRRLAHLNRSSISSFQADLDDIEVSVRNLRVAALAILDQVETVKDRMAAAKARLETHLALVNATERDNRVLDVPAGLAAARVPDRNDLSHDDDSDQGGE